jgi:hypothetical protein
MRLTRPTSLEWLLLTLIFAAHKAGAQLAPADDFFNGGAQLYISNNIPAALERTEDGLKLYPDNEKLKKLEQLLKQQQSQSQSQQNRQQQKSQSQKNSNGQKNQQQQDSQSQQQKQDEQKKDEQQKQAQQQKSNDEKKQNQNAENQPVAGQMTPEEAKRLLDAQKDDEQVLQFKPQGKPENPNQPAKDW